jgi:large subunit ribosomal protein L9
MKVILIKDVQNLGHAGDVKEVSGGYAKNFLIPGGFARVATAGAMKKAEEVRTQREEKSQKDLEKAKELADKMQGETVTVQGKADPSKKLYASIKPEEIAQALQAKGYEVDKSEIVIGEPIKELGEFEVAVRLEHGLEVNIGVIVEAQ